MSIFLIYILFSHFTANNGHKIRKSPSTGGMAYMDYDGIMPDYGNFPRWFSGFKVVKAALKGCHINAATQKLPCSVSEPCLYPCNKIVLTPKNMTKELQTKMDMNPSEKVVSVQEILLVPRCPCSDKCAGEERREYSFSIIDANGTPQDPMNYTILYCVKC